MAHQMNLVFGDIFKENAVFQKITKEAVRIVSYFHNSTFFYLNYYIIKTADKIRSIFNMSVIYNYFVIFLFEKKN